MSDRQELIRRLDSANEIRMARARFKQQVKSGTTSVLDVLRAETPWWFQTMPVEQLLAVTPSFQRRVLNRILRRAGLNSGSTVGHLTARQLRSLIADLEEWEAARDFKAQYRKVAA